MEFTSNQLEFLEKRHLNKLYQTFQSILGTRYRLYVQGFEFCCYPENEIKGISLNQSKYSFVLSPMNQRDYDSVTIKNLYINEVMDYMNLIVMERGKELWKAYYKHGGKKKN